MKTKEQYEDMVRGPGKFEMEKPWTPYFWELAINEEGETVYKDTPEDEDLEIDYDKFIINGDDSEIFPELDAFIGHEIRVWEDSQGFVYSSLKSLKP